ncbi:hypothetical protein [Nocardia salmonicida]|uniref:hypothetical protein n=1 Tax=Nocardia salmonicida TaxID=53431 RepID=UPI0037B7E1D1
MADQKKPKDAYPSDAKWFADLDHTKCGKTSEGICYDIHCVYCGAGIGTGWVPCPCRKENNDRHTDEPVRLSDDRLRRIRDGWVTRGNETLEMAAELLAARGRVTELEAAQREPSGYVVGWQESDGRVTIALDESEPTPGGPDRFAYADLGDAHMFLAELSPEDPDTAFHIYGLHEVTE